MESKLLVTVSPHIKSPMTTQKVMLNVLIALVPAAIASVILFGWRSLLLIAVTNISCVLFETLFNMVTKRPNTVADLSALVTGTLLAMNLPVTLPLWMAVVGAFVAIVIAKMLFGGLGQNFANPAILARIVLLISFSTAMTTWAKPLQWLYGEANTGATPLASASVMAQTSYLDLFLGNKGGCLGEVSVLALLIGGLFLIFRGIITPTIPFTYIATMFVFSWLFGADPVAEILSGGLMIGAFFMATDYTTSPFTEKGKIIFGVGLGLITAVIRAFGSYPEGVSFSILLMNILVPYIDKLTRTKPFGRVKV
ncbi:RnfABCDGE type electron transport complex subunit D [Acetanaerobacterium elongatum]|uniref:Ion-translocating oxidoreductase complex subunit D n=1 Tax=Acetanaerobacterium elongatum TaxID=258515 RepID=A0A1G9XCP8_9FIRM|nr:RnfABCDGE type electron transport complex subunit D [Acetanaerobacterium elongatum]SDM94216.1 electron transport complex protein RnfD [Acetanaerobacterium elongatum]